MTQRTENITYGLLWSAIILGLAAIIAGIWLNDWRWLATGGVVAGSATITLLAITTY